MPDSIDSDASRLKDRHINYLIFRYLQENGFEATATTFVKDWKLPDRLTDPEHLPFAPVVPPRALDQLFRDGLKFDEARARCTYKSGPKKGENIERSYRFASPNAQIPGHAAPDPESARLKAQVAASRARVEAAQPSTVTPTPALSGDAIMSRSLKKAKKGNENQQSNGARADDTSADAEGEDTEMAEAEALGMEETAPGGTEAAVETYDAENAATQTTFDRPTCRTDQVAWRFGGRDEKVMFLAWNPSLSHSSKTTLLTAGESLCKLNSVEGVAFGMGGDPQTKIKELADPYTEESTHDVSAVAWHPQGEYITIASLPSKDPLQLHSELHDLAPIAGMPWRFNKRNSDVGLDPPGVVLRMKYSPTGQHLSTVKKLSHGGSKVIIFEAADEFLKELPKPVGGRTFFGSQVLDIAWSADESLFLCGTNGLLRQVKIDASATKYSSMEGIVEGLQEFPLSRAGEAALDFDRIKCDTRTGIVACTASVAGSSTEGSRVVALLAADDISSSKAENLPFDVKLDYPEQITGLAINTPQPQFSAASGPSFMAISLLSGRCVVLAMERGAAAADCRIKHSSTEVELTEGHLLTVKWSPNGRYLALGGNHQVLVFDFKTFPTAGEKFRAIADWKPFPFTVKGSDGNTEFASTTFSDTNSADSGFEDGTNADEDEGAGTVGETKLSWCADGAFLAYAGSKMVRVTKVFRSTSRKVAIR